MEKTNKVLQAMADRKRYIAVVGIDTGTHTGYAVWKPLEHCFTELSTLKIHVAMRNVLNLKQLYGDKLLVRFEDARQRKWFGDSGREKLQGAGSVKRDSKIWEDFLMDNEIDFEMVKPKARMTKLNAKTFRALSYYSGQTSEHSRDAGMLVLGM